ncbi:hypothetical protein ILYODFUR_013051 [Ilyodon furcidens]|uniref:Uncharacterized protein n=1 Tax=Ilyodon furcidens TaxID=33524 RepID=A0ABV0TU66_9TELE
MQNTNKIHLAKCKQNTKSQTTTKSKTKQPNEGGWRGPQTEGESPKTKQPNQGGRRGPRTEGENPKNNPIRASQKSPETKQPKQGEATESKNKTRPRVHKNKNNPMGQTGVQSKQNKTQGLIR